MRPGEYILSPHDIEANKGRRTIKITVANTGDRPVQIGSHFHFFEVNKALDFNRAKTFGMRLNIPAGTAVRFEPGEDKEVVLAEISGKKTIRGLNNLTNGSIRVKAVFTGSLNKAAENNFKGVKRS